jgi:toxin ParE1/3/4
MLYRTTIQADADVAELFAQGIRRFGIDRSERYVADLLRCFDRLAEHPLMARERRELSPPVRVHPHASHVIAYLAHEDTILIVRVLDARQDWETGFSATPGT